LDALINWDGTRWTILEINFKSISECNIPSSAVCKVNSKCLCKITNCNLGWIRARLPDNSEFTKYFTPTGFFISSGTKSGTANGYISCNDDGKEYPTSIQIV
jgi:hypothetical protein